MWELILEHSIDFLFAGLSAFMAWMTRSVIKEKKKLKEEEEKRLID